jgi:UDP-2,3-diacylglucosamine hydrolase
MELEKDKKIYFISDSHLGIPDKKNSLIREKKIVNFLDEIKKNAAELYLLGDIFDFWFEYKNVVPKGYVRLLGKLAELADNGIIIKYFTGNHDMWMLDYFEKELNIEIIRNPISMEYNGKKFYIAHGDGLGPADNGYKFLKFLFSCKTCRKLYSFIHPDWGIPVARYFSNKSRYSRKEEQFNSYNEKNERLIDYSKQLIEKENYDFLIFGHRHLPVDIKINNNVRYINIGDWLYHFSYLEFDGENIRLKFY